MPNPLLPNDPSPAPSPAPAPAPAPADPQDGGPNPSPTPAPTDNPFDIVPEEVRSQLFTEDGQWNADGFEKLTTPKPREDVPSSADAYELPEIEGFDREQANKSPLFTALRGAAFEGGMGQEQFTKAIEQYVKAETDAADAHAEAQRTELGSNAEKRIETVSDFLSRNLSADEYRAVLPATSSAKGIAALERLMNIRANPQPREGDPPPPAMKTKKEIEAIMQSDEYRGKPGVPPDPKVRKEVDDWFQKNAGNK